MNKHNQLDTTSRSRVCPATNGTGKTIKSRGFVNIGKIILKVLHIWVAGYSAVTCPIALLKHCNSWPSVILCSFLSSACFIWFVVAVGFWSGPWFQRISLVGTTVVKVVNVVLAGVVLTCCIYSVFWGQDPVTTSVADGVTTTSAVKKGLQQDSVGLLVCVSIVPLLWLLCAIGLLFKKRWARWGNLMIVFGFWSCVLCSISSLFYLIQHDDFGMIAGVLTMVFCMCWWFFFLIGGLSALLFSFLISTRCEYMGIPMPQTSRPEIASPLR